MPDPDRQEGAAIRRIEVLPDDLANQIAAGEVVERPASIVKELVENAVDAEATRIEVVVERGGCERVRVRDDGVGMHPQDAERALIRHATSKIRRSEDLSAISTFGFRGEALPSIASVSRFSLTTRPSGQDHATRVEVEGGGPVRAQPASGPPGTEVDVRELFFNVPARKKFLRAVGTESAHITEAVQMAALAHPSVTFLLERDGRTVREFLRVGARRERVAQVLRGESLREIAGERGLLAVEAHLSPPERARAGAGSLSIFVNGRPVRDRSLARAVAHAYGSVLDAGRYPVGVVYLTLPTELVDVNVHPQKAEVRFADGRAVSDAVYHILSDGLRSAFGLDAARASGAPAVSAPAHRPSPEEDRSAWLFQGGGSLPARDARGAWASPPRDSDPAAAPPTFGQSTFGQGGEGGAIADGAGPDGAGPDGAGPDGTGLDRAGVAYASLRFVAQVRQTFLLCEGPDGLYVLDQHAAAERVTFDRLRRGFASRAVAVQRLAFPESVDVSPQELAWIGAEEELLSQMGLEVRALAGRAVVSGVPQILARSHPERLLRDLLAELRRQGGRSFSGAVDLVLATMACHGSIRAGDTVTAEQGKALLARLGEVDFAGHCPHGRPILSRITWAELESRVGRR